MQIFCKKEKKNNQQKVFDFILRKAFTDITDIKMHRYKTIFSS